MIADASEALVVEDAAGELVEKLTRPRPRLMAFTAVMGLVALLLPLCWIYQIREGIGVAGINRPVFWGLYIINFVFWIGISHAGTLISAILRVTQAEWRRPVTRLAEAITVFSICVGGLFPLIHLGRPLIFFYMLPLPNDRYLWPNFRSPLMWDVVAITTYLTGSILYLTLPLIPDLAILRDRFRGEGGWRSRLYRILAMGWQGTQRQWRALHAGIGILAVVIIPVAVSVHSIVSWDFAMSKVPGWHSTIFGPYFVVGAIYSGIAVLLVAMALLRWGLALSDVLTDKVFSNLSLLFVAMAIIWGYFTYAEHLTTWYGGGEAEERVHHALMGGGFGQLFWLMVFLNMAVPLAVLPFRWGRKPIPVTLVGLCVLVGMWLERLLIVVPSLSTPRLEYTVGTYSPTWVEIGIFVGSIGSFVFLYLVFMQLFPIVSVWEIEEGRHGEH